MTTPLESIENTVTRLRVKVGPHGYHADEIERLTNELKAARMALKSDVVELRAWEGILDTLKADQRDLETFKEEFLRRHHPELKPREWATGGLIQDYKPNTAILMNSGDYIVKDDSDKLLGPDEEYVSLY